jgi:glutamate-1-semialdehyde 2,1-aminomutase
MASGNGTSALSRAYRDAFPAWEQLSQRAERVLAGGSIHDSQLLRPLQPFFDRARGAYKWSGEQRFVDYWMGHGSLLLGHSFPPVVEAVMQQVAQGTHLGGTHEAVLRWAEIVCELVPAAERVRFTSSGTEATLLALRVARAFTGRDWLLKFNGHFHGWHDEVMAYFSPAEESGFKSGTIEHVALAESDDIESIAEFLADRSTAAVILEPGGGSSGAYPWSPEFLRALREVTREHGTLLVFDEVVSGFRYSPGGVQALCGVTPDLTVLGKILSGGLPGAAIAGRSDVMAVFGSGVEIAGRHARVPHTGTFNGNPISAVAGVAMLEHVRDGVAQEAARRAAARLVAGVNAAAEAADVDVRTYTNDSSIFHIEIGGRAAASSDASEQAVSLVVLFSKYAERYASLRRALLVEGLDCHPLHGWVSAVHDDEAIDASIAAFERAFRRLREEGPA